MRSITIARLKATLSAELRRVRKGESVAVLDRITPVAVLGPVPGPVRVVQPAEEPYAYRRLSPLTAHDPWRHLDDERGERW